MAIERSASIPFLKRPPALDGTMVGDVGFDPLGITTTIKELGGDLNYVREAELMHGRQSMLALVGFVFPGAHPMTCAPPSSVRRARQPRGAAAPPLHRLLLQRLGLLTRRAPLLLAAVVGKLPVDWNEAVSTNPIAAQYEVHMRMQMHSPMHMRAQSVRTTRATATVSPRARAAVIGRPSCQPAPRRVTPRVWLQAVPLPSAAACPPFPTPPFPTPPFPTPPFPSPPLSQLPPQILAQLFLSMAVAEGLRAQVIFKGDRPPGAPPYLLWPSLRWPSLLWPS